MSDDAHHNNNNDEDAPLPRGWTRNYSKSQKRYYYVHAESKHTQWHFPTASEAADPEKAKRRAEQYKERETHKKQRSPHSPVQNKKAKTDDDFLALADATSVAIVVPYRDLHPSQNRAAQLQKFVPHMHSFLREEVKKGRMSEYHIYIVEQSDDGRKFNRGKLLNIGFEYARKNSALKFPHDVFIFHDVDLLPSTNLGKWYSQFPKTPLHIARVWDRYNNNPNYFGGIVSFSSSHFKRINGFPNTFWGWGGEDDELKKRLDKLGIVFDYPTSGGGDITDLEEMNLTEKLDFLRQNKQWKCMVKWEALDEHEQTWKTNGLADLNYQILQTKKLDDTGKATLVTADVKLNGNHWSNDKCGVDFLGDWSKKPGNKKKWKK